MRLLLFVCTALVMAAGLATAQQPSVRVKGSGLVGVQPGSVLDLLQREEVRNDLETSDDVVSKLKSLRDDFQAASQKEYRDAGINPRDVANMTAEQRRKLGEIGKKIDDEFSAKGKEMLTADQNKRLRQIQLQYRLNLSGPTALLAPDVAAELKLTDDQRQAFQTLRAEFVRNLLPRGGGNGREAVEKNRQNQELAITKAIDVLTAEQKETLNQLRGNEFDVSSFGISVSAGPAVAQQGAVAQQKNEATVESGRVHPDFILTLAANEAVQKDLRVSEEVATKLVSMYRRDFLRAETKALEEVGVVGMQAKMQMEINQRSNYKAIAKKVQEDFLPQLQELLTAEQFQRLRQIQFQNRFNMNGPKTLLEPDVAAAIKPTDFQTLQLELVIKDYSERSPFRPVRGKSAFFPYGTAGIQYGEEYREKAIAVLTAEQQEALAKLEGEAFDLTRLVSLSRPMPPRK